jgi:hypothetical protein
VLRPERVLSVRTVTSAPSLHARLGCGRKRHTASAKKAPIVPSLPDTALHAVLDALVPRLGSFYAADTFNGGRRGFEFKLGICGVGYYESSSRSTRPLIDIRHQASLLRACALTQRRWNQRFRPRLRALHRLFRLARLHAVSVSFQQQCKVVSRVTGDWAAQRAAYVLPLQAVLASARAVTVTYDEPSGRVAQATNDLRAAHDAEKSMQRTDVAANIVSAASVSVVGICARASVYESLCEPCFDIGVENLFTDSESEDGLSPQAADHEDTLSLRSAQPAGPPAPQRCRCRFADGSGCYRNSPVHMAQYSHPGDYDWDCATVSLDLTGGTDAEPANNAEPTTAAPTLSMTYTARPVVTRSSRPRGGAGPPPTAALFPSFYDRWGGPKPSKARDPMNYRLDNETAVHTSQELKELAHWEAISPIKSDVSDMSSDDDTDYSQGSGSSWLSQHSTDSTGSWTGSSHSDASISISSDDDDY